MKYLSLFSGIEAASVAWEQLGWECVAVSEILPYQSSVLEKHYPNVPNFGDVTKITEDDMKSLGDFDVVIFGSPCQDLSVAGQRLGLHAQKDNTNHSSILFYEGMRVFRLAQKYCGARFLVWENVPGALTSNRGVDFGKIIETMVGCKFNQEKLIWGNEGMCFGKDSMLEWSVLDAKWFGVAQRRRRLFVILDTGDWQNRSTILLEPKSLRGNPEKVGKKKETTTSKIERISNTPINSKLNTYCYDMQAIGEYGDSDIASTIKARDYKDATDLIVEEPIYAIAGNIIGRNPELRTGGNGNGFNEGVMYTMTAGDHHAVSYTTNETHVRKLTPVECERLQGFPDNWTLVDDKTPYSKRINALGRSMAVPVIKWIGGQIEKSIK